MNPRPDDLGPEARARRARRETEARADLDRMRAERDKEDALRRQHDLQQREEKRRADFERRVDEAVAALEREATMPLRERVRLAMLTGQYAAGAGAGSRERTRPADDTRRRVGDMRREIADAMATVRGPAPAPQPPARAFYDTRSELWWARAKTADIRAAAEQAGYASAAEFVAERCPFRRDGSGA